jgi:hypothetical protein
VIFGKELSGLQRLLRRVARTAWAARDRLSLDTWRAIYALTTSEERYEEPAAAFDGTGALAYLDMLIRRTAALSGLADENMTRGNNWLFFDLGRRIERTLAACWLVRHTLAVPDERESGAIQVALEIADSAMTYSYRYRNAFQAAPAIDLLLLDASNPRAVGVSINAIARHAAELPMAPKPAARRARALAESVRARISSADAYALDGHQRRRRTRHADRAARRRRGSDEADRRRARRCLPAAPATVSRMTNYTVRHRTTYTYESDVAYSRLIAHLVPRETARQRTRDVEVTLAPEPLRSFERTDFFGNTTSWFIVDEPHDDARDPRRKPRDGGSGRGPIRQRAGRGKAVRAPFESSAADAMRSTPCNIRSIRRSRPRPTRSSPTRGGAFRPAARCSRACSNSTRASTPTSRSIKKRRHAHDRQGCLRAARRRVPGSRARRDRLRARDGSRRALRERLPADASAGRAKSG